MGKKVTSSLRAQWLGERLKKARTAAGYTLREAADYLQLHEGTMSRFETATYAVRKSYVKDLIDFYGVSVQRERDALLQLCEDAWRKDWWDGQAADVESEFIDYTWLESRATQICAFEPMLIHGLLQTEPYARETISQLDQSELSEQQLDRLVDFRMLRQRVLAGTSPTALLTVMEEVALRRPVGDRELQRAALARLLEAGARENVEIRILETDVGLHRGMSGPFTLFKMPEPYSDVAFVESLAGRTYLERQDRVAGFTLAFDDLVRVSMSPKDSLKFIRKLHKEIK